MGFTTNDMLIDLTPRAETRGLPIARQRLDERLFDCTHNVSRQNVIAVVGPQGGAGKTRVTFALGSALADSARLNVVAVDLDDDYGALLDLVPEKTRSAQTVETMMLEHDGLVPFPELRKYLSWTRSSMMVLRGPEESTDRDEMLARLQNADVVIFDCAAGLHRPRAEWAISRADQVIVVARPEVSGAASAAFQTQRALADVTAHGILVVNRRSRRSGTKTQEAFVNVAGLATTVHIPDSGRLARAMESQTYRIEGIDRQTRAAIKKLATLVGEQLR